MFHSHAYEQFNFDVTEMEIKEEGNLFIGRKRGIASTRDALLIEADEFKYNKLLNILNANGTIIFKDTKKNIQIFADKLIYLKNTEEVFLEGNSKVINNDGIIITADKLEYEKFNNLIEAIGNVEIIDTKKNYMINANHIKYFKNEEKILSIGKANAVIEKNTISNHLM